MTLSSTPPPLACVPVSTAETPGSDWVLGADAIPSELDCIRFLVKKHGWHMTAIRTLVKWRKG